MLLLQDVQSHLTSWPVLIGTLSRRWPLINARHQLLTSSRANLRNSRCMIDCLSGRGLLYDWPNDRRRLTSDDRRLYHRPLSVIRRLPHLFIDDYVIYPSTTMSNLRRLYHQSTTVRTMARITLTKSYWLWMFIWPNTTDGVGDELSTTEFICDVINTINTSTQTRHKPVVYKQTNKLI